jgi:hypothetical protein
VRGDAPPSQHFGGRQEQQVLPTGSPCVQRPVALAIASAFSRVSRPSACLPPQNARYFCTGEAPDDSFWRHFALAVSHYTHYTSPIRCGRGGGGGMGLCSAINDCPLPGAAVANCTLQH